MNVFIISTEAGDILLDSRLELVKDESTLEPTTAINFADTTLAPAEDWEDWLQTMTKGEIVQKIRPAVAAKLRAISNEVNHMYGRVIG